MRDCTEQRRAARRRRFGAVLALIAVLAFGVRTAFVLVVARHDHHLYDAFFYELEADGIAEGHGFTDPFASFHPGQPPDEPAADHPPLTVVTLAGAAWLFGTNQLVHRFTTALAGVGVVVLIGLLGRKIAGRRAGLIAAGIGAVYPFLWLNDGLIMSEAFALLLTCGAVLACYWLRDRPTLIRAAALGGLCGLAGLTRAELILLTPLLVAIALLAVATTWRRKAAVAAAALGATLAVIAPWAIYNSARFHDPVVLSTNDGLTLLGANCDATYYGPGVGSWVLDERCIPTEPPPGDQSEVSAEYRHRALSYVSHHLSRLPVVTAARLGRTWGVFGIRDGIESGQGEGRPEWATVVGLVLYYPLVVVSIIGFLTLHRRRWLMPLLAPIVIVTLTAMVFYGQARLRAPAEPMLVVLAGVTLANWWERIEHRRSPGRRAIMVQQHRQ